MLRAKNKSKNNNLDFSQIFSDFPACFSFLISDKIIIVFYNRLSIHIYIYMEEVGSVSGERAKFTTKKNPCQEKNFKTHEKNFAPCLLCSDQKHAIILGKDQRKEGKAMNNQGVCKTTILHVPAGRFAFVAGKEGMTIAADHGVIEIGFQSPDDAKFILQLIIDNCERVLKSLEG